MPSRGRLSLPSPLFILLLLHHVLLCHFSLAGASSAVPLKSLYGDTKASARLLRKATDKDLESALTIVKSAMAEARIRNKARHDHMARNIYSLAPGTGVGDIHVPLQSRGLGSASKAAAPPALLSINSTVAAAAALIAEADAAGITGQNFTVEPVQRRATAFWMEGLARKGTVPWGNDASYQVFRNVKNNQYGKAVGDGKTDDTAAIQAAMLGGNRCAKNCNGATTKNAIVYFPPGTYLVSSTLEIPFGTQIIGDANSRPTILAAPSFVGLGVLSTDKYTGGGTGADGKDQEYYINTANFYRQIRNVIIDIRGTQKGQYVAGIHYQVAQATSTQNVDLIATTGTTQQGMFSENGSGGQLSDINFRGGDFGFYGGNQQFTAQRLTFVGCGVAVQTIWDWGWVWKSCIVVNCKVGFQLVPQSANSGSIGSASFLDSQFSSVGTAIVTVPINSKSGSGSTGVILENVQFSSVTNGVADNTGKVLLAGGNVHIDEWATGPIYSPNRTFSMGANAPKYVRVPSLLDTTKAMSPFYERRRPQYETKAATDFVHIKDLGAKGDGKTDDTAAFQSALNNNVGKLLFIDAGTYILKNTVTIPKGSILIGEAWSQIAASGPNFSDMTKPRAMLKVGNAGDVGSVEMQDLIFTTQGPTAGAILVEWNLQADVQGSAGLWDCHARVGGATGTGLTSTQCPPSTSGIDSGCQGATMMMHITPSASGYFENMWLWGADHDIDDPNLNDPNNTMVQCSVYVARGILIESRAPVWLYATAAEHAVYYQYNFYEASTVFAGMIQTESPYYQPNPKPPAPFTTSSGVEAYNFPGDPFYKCGNDFDGCDASWAVIVQESSNITVASAGLYSWFSTYSQDCLQSHSCQKALLLLTDNGPGIRFMHLITIGAKYSIVQDGKGILATDNLNSAVIPWWSQISIFDATPDPGYGAAGNITLSPLPKCDATYSSLDAILSDMSKIPTYCVNAYVVSVLSLNITGSLTAFKTLANGDYDKKFATYSKAISQQLPASLNGFVWKNGDTYFNCKVDKYVTCCSSCNTPQCGADCDKSSGCVSGKRQVSAPCPTQDPYDSTIGSNNTANNNWYWSWKGSTSQNDFFTALANATGIDQSWVNTNATVPAGPTSSFCDSPTPDKDCTFHWYGYVQVKSNVVIPNPKDVIGKALGNYTDLATSMNYSSFGLTDFMFVNQSVDFVDGSAVAVFMAASSITQMNNVVATADKIAEAERKAIILGFIGAILLLVPVVGEAVDGLGLATLSRLITLAGNAGNAGLGIYGFVEDPKSIIFALFGALFGAKSYTGSAQVRRAFTTNDLTKLGPDIKAALGKVDQVKVRCI